MLTEALSDNTGSTGQRRRRRRGSDVEDIFNPNPDDDDVDTDDAASYGSEGDDEGSTSMPGGNSRRN